MTHYIRTVLIAIAVTGALAGTVAMLEPGIVVDLDKIDPCLVTDGGNNTLKNTVCS